MIDQIGFSHSLRRALKRRQEGRDDERAATTARKTTLGTTKKLLAVGGVAVGLGGLGLFGSVATAAATADGLAATPMPPAVIDDDGFQNYKTSTYPADPTWPASPSWPGRSSNPCCSR